MPKTTTAKAAAKTPRPRAAPAAVTAPAPGPVLLKDDLEERRRTLLSTPEQRAMFAQGAPGRRMYLTIYGTVATFERQGAARQVGGPTIDAKLPSDWFAWLGPDVSDEDDGVGGVGRT